MENKYLELNPVIDETVEKTYKEVFDYVLKKDRIRNIAISGIYGSGKSTVCESYFNEHKTITKDEIIYVALGNYDNNEQNNNQSKNNQNNENRIEKQIINQILFQVKSSKIPLSNYQIKETKNSKIILKTIFTSLFISLAFLWLLFFINNKNYDISKWQNITFISVMSASTFLFLFILIFFIFRNYQFKFLRIKFNKYLEMQDRNNPNNKETTLDKEMKELVYILKYSKVKVVIFEDLDRFDMVEIFTKLKELNFCLNKAKEKNKNKVKNKDNENIVRFFYLIKDSLFSEPEERTKFFDFIIPVVPYINSNNSFQKLNELLNGVLDETQRPNEEFLSNISLYIDDMRLLKNVINEYKICFNAIKNEKIKLKTDNFFALILIKNIFPKEYDQLLKNKGIIFEIIKKISDYRGKLKERYLENIKNLENKIQDLQILGHKNKWDYIASKVPISILTEKGFVTTESFSVFLMNWFIKEKDKKRTIFGHSVNYDEFIKFLEDKKYVNWSLDSEFYQLDYEDKQKTIEKTKKEIIRYKNKIHKSSSADFSLIVSEINKNENLFFNNLQEKYNLIKMLILENFLDDNYFYYTSFIYGEESNYNDIVFLKKIYENNQEINEFHQLSNVDKIYTKLKDEYYSRPFIINYYLIIKIIEENDKNKILILFEMIKELEKEENIIKIFEKFEYKLINKLLKIIWEDFDHYWLLSLFNKSNQLSAIFILLIFSDDYFYEQKLFSELKEQIENNSLILENFTKVLIDEISKTKFINNIINLDIKFNNITDLKIENEIWKLIENNSLFSLNLINLQSLLKGLEEQQMDNSNYDRTISFIYESTNMEMTKKYLDQNFDNFIENEYIPMVINSKLKFNNEEKETEKILNSKISAQSKHTYIKNNLRIFKNTKSFKLSTLLKLYLEENQKDLKKFSSN